MSAESIRRLADEAYFRPTSKHWLLSESHVRLDELLHDGPKYESLAIRRLTDAAQPQPVAIVGGSGSGKSSLVTWVSASLPEAYVAIRLPVSALENPTDSAEALKLSLGTILATVELDADAREELHIERAERRMAERAPTGFTGGKIGGGPIPGEVNIQLGSLRQEFSEDKLAGDYLTGVNRAVGVLEHEGVRPVFVIEDTEAVVSRGTGDELVDGFFEGPLNAFVREIAAPCLVAVQTHLTVDRSSFARLAAVMQVIEIPHLRDEARDALTRILDRRLDVGQAGFGIDDVLGDDALDGLVQFYDDVTGDIRKTLAAAQDAAEDAAGMSAETIRAAHVRVGAANWR